MTLNTLHTRDDLESLDWVLMRRNRDLVHNGLVILDTYARGEMFGVIQVGSDEWLSSVFAQHPYAWWGR